MIDGLLEAWHSTGDRAIPHTKVIGHPWNARSSEVREFLARNRLYYSWFRSDELKGQQLLEAAGLDGQTLPVVVTELAPDPRRSHRFRAGGRPRIDTTPPRTSTTWSLSAEVPRVWRPRYTAPPRG